MTDIELFARKKRNLMVDLLLRYLFFCAILVSSRKCFYVEYDEKKYSLQVCFEMISAKSRQKNFLKIILQIVNKYDEEMEKMKKSLGLFEELNLFFQGKRDARGGAFEWCDRFGNDPDNAETDIVAVSSRMNNEAGNFAYENDSRINNIKCVYRIPDGSKKGKRKKATFGKAFEDIEKRIAKGRNDIEIKAAEFSDEVKKINMEWEGKSIVKNRPEIIAMYDRRRAMVRHEFASVANVSREQVLALLDEEVRLLRILERSSTESLDRYRNRIGAYYRGARDEDNSLPVNNIKIQELLHLNGIYIFESYKERIENANNIRDSLLGLVRKDDQKGSATV